MVRKTFRITEIQAWMLKLRAKREGVPESELIRRAVDVVLETPSTITSTRQRYPRTGISAS